MDASEMRKRVFPSISFSSLVENESIIFESEKEKERVSWFSKRIDWNRCGPTKSWRKLEEGSMRFSLKNRGTDPHRKLAFNQRAGYRENLWPRALCKKCYPSQRAIIENTVRVYFWGKERSSLKTSTRLFIRTTRCPCVRLSLSLFLISFYHFTPPFPSVSFFPLTLLLLSFITL